MSNLPPIAYTIAGSDSCCGAGAQIDLKVFSKFKYSWLFYFNSDNRSEYNWDK